MTDNLTTLTNKAPIRAMDAAEIVTPSLLAGSIITATPKKPIKVKIILIYPGFSPRSIIARGTRNNILVKPKVTALAKGIIAKAVNPAVIAPIPRIPLNRCNLNLLVWKISTGLFKNNNKPVGF